MNNASNWENVDMAAAEKLFYIAVAYYKAMDCTIERLKITHPEEGSTAKDDIRELGLLIPAAMLASFWLELSLKALCALDRGGYRKTHDVAKIYQDLNASTRDDLKARFTGGKIEDTLDRCKQAFEKVRYIHSATLGDGEGVVGSDIAKIACRHIQDRKPEWKP